MGSDRSDGRSDELTLTAFERTDSNGTREVGCTVEARSHDFQAKLKQNWFACDDVRAFVREGRLVASHAAAKAELRAMSKFALVLTPADQRGGFALVVEMESPLHGNRATIRVELQTQTLLELLEELEREAR